MANLTKRGIVLGIYEKMGFPQKEITAIVQLVFDPIQKAVSEGRNA